jgi:cell division septum initiation protein DivIVA
MDVTPRELRDIDIRERFGGYNRDDVDDLLERAAARIEGLEGQVRDLSTRAEAGDVESGKTRETEEMLHRTLLLAQRAADEAVAEAQTKARQILDEAETKSRTMVSEAETTARRQAETERRRLESEVLELGAKRDALVADVDALDRFEQDYRVRLRRAVEADLEQLSSKGSVAPSPRPTTHDVEMPASGSGGASSAPGAGTPAESAPPAPAASTPPPVPAPPVVPPLAADTPSPASSSSSPPAAPAPPPAFGVAAAAPSSTSEDAPASPPPPSPFSQLGSTPGVESSAPASAPTPPGASEGSAELPWEEAPTPAAARPPLFDAEPEPEHLDDDAFFASLREAVTDETPLGPRDPAPGSAPYDQDDRGGLFRRRGR